MQNQIQTSNKTTSLTLNGQPLLRPNLAILSEDYPKVRHTQPQEVSGLLNYFLAVLNIQKASTTEELEKMDMQMLLVGDLIRTKFGSLTIPEIKEAMKMYVSKEFAHIKVFRLLDCVAIGDILSAYIEFRNEKLTLYSFKKNNLLNQSNELTEQEKEARHEEYLQMVFKELKETDFCSEAWYLYQDLFDKGKIWVTDDQKKALYERELRIFASDQKNEFSKKDPILARNLMLEFKEKIASKTKFEYVKNRCKSVLTSEYLCGYLTDFETFKKAIKL